MKLIICQIINFVILFGALGWFCRNLILRMFKGRREKIADDLKKAEEAAASVDTIAARIEEEKAATELQKETTIADAKKQAETTVSEAVSVNAADAEKVRETARSEEANKRNLMLEEVNLDAIRKIRTQTGEALKGDKYAAARQALTARCMKDAEAQIVPTAADLTAVRRGQELASEVISAAALTDAEAAQLESIIAAKFGAEIKPVYKTDANLIGGLRVQVGDTVYDGTLSHKLELVESNAEIQLRGSAADMDVDSSIRSQIAGVSDEMDVYQIGKIISLGDGICRVSGLSDCMAGEMLEFPGGLTGMVQDLDRGNVGVVLLGSYENIQEGDEVRRTGRILEVPVGEAMIGRVVNALGQPIDGKGAINASAYRPIESPAPSVVARKSVSVPLQTGMKAIDALVPIGRGQRELIIGDRQTGKTALALDTIINQKTENVICIYVAIGQKESTIASFVEKLRQTGAIDYTIVVSANASEPAPMLYIAPYAGAAMGEHFMYQGKDVLIIYDDLTKQANAYRELSLLLQRPPGREAYPGDVFYLHSRLLERAARLSEEAGGGSMTALPIIETQAGDISAYIPTNVISITDGQIFLETDLFHSGVRPAINVGLSVSRVGGAAQVKAMKQFAGRLRMELAQYRELASFAQFGSDLDKSTQATLLRGEHMTEILKQDQYQPMDVADQVVMIYAGSEGYTDDVALDEMKEFEANLLTYVHTAYPELSEVVHSGKKLEGESLAKLRECIESFKASRQ